MFPPKLANRKGQDEREREQFCHVWSPRNRHNEVRGQRTSFDDFPLAAARLELHDFLDTDAKNPELLLYDVLRHVCLGF
jgi:hypothetical protein